MHLLRSFSVAAAVLLSMACEGPTASYNNCAVTCGSEGICPSSYFCSADNYCHLETEFPVSDCRIDAGAPDAPVPDAHPPDAPVPDAPPMLPDAAPPDATPPDASTTCVVGTAMNTAAVADPERFGDVILFASGRDLPAGSYRIEYVDGCFKFFVPTPPDTGAWTIHWLIDAGTAAWWLVGATAAERLVLLPGTAPTTEMPNAFETFSECVAANLLVRPIEYQHAGGPLGIYLADLGYADNISGEDGRNPKWRLVSLEPCPD